MRIWPSYFIHRREQNESGTLRRSFDFVAPPKSNVFSQVPLHHEDGVVVVVPGRDGPGAATVALVVRADEAADAAAGAPVVFLRAHLGIRGGPMRDQVAIVVVILGSQARSLVPWPVVGSGDAVEVVATEA